jgi:hypothetical protein
MENAAWPTSTATSCTTPDQGARTTPLGPGGRKRRFRRSQLRFEIDQLQPRQRAVENQLALGVELGALLRDQSFRLHDLRLARFVGQDGDGLALLHPGAAFDLELGKHPAGAGGDGDVLVRFGAAGHGELAAVRNEAGLRDRHAEKLLRFAVARANGGAAFRALVRQQVAGGDPQGGRGHQPDGCETARFHRELSFR